MSERYLVETVAIFSKKLGVPIFQMVLDRNDFSIIFFYSRSFGQDEARKISLIVKRAVNTSIAIGTFEKTDVTEKVDLKFQNCQGVVDFYNACIAALKVKN